jgi:hypothetical protein
MKAGSLLSILLLAIIALATGGCSTTLVESLPVGKTTTCDAAWPGRWKAMEPGNSSKPGEEVWLQINADCTELLSIDKEKTERENHKITLVSTRAGDFLWISDDRKPSCIPGSTHCGMELVRYVRSGDEIRLYNPDHKKVHDAIDSHAVAGYTEAHVDEKAAPASEAATSTGSPAQAPSPANASGQQNVASDNAQYDNQIVGNPEQIAAILEKHPEFFESTPWLTLRRDDPANKKKSP